MLRRQPTPPLFPYTTLFRSRVHRIGYAAVDMALDDDDVVGPLGPALDREHVGDLGRRRQTIAAECFAGTLDGQAIPARNRVAVEFALSPVERRADPALGIGLR